MTNNWRNNLPLRVSLSALCFSMILFLVVMKYVWGELRNYERMCKQTELSAATRQRHVQLAFIESRKNPAPQNAIRHKRHRRSTQLIKQPNPANSDDSESDAIKILPAPGSLDTDGDGLYDVEEEILGTDYLRPDTDGDGLNDMEELKMGLDPISYDSATNNSGYGKAEGNGDGSIQFGTFSYPSSGSRQTWNPPTPKTKRGRKPQTP